MEIIQKHKELLEDIEELVINKIQKTYHESLHNYELEDFELNEMRKSLEILYFIKELKK